VAALSHAGTRGYGHVEAGALAGAGDDADGGLGRGFLGARAAASGGGYWQCFSERVAVRGSRPWL
jgi:hypothetical protein